MDFDELYKVLPKAVKKWKVDDCCKFIKFIELSQYEKTIRDNSIDGSILLKLTKEEIHLIIPAPIPAKKFSEWIKSLNDYDTFISEKEKKHLDSTMNMNSNYNCESIYLPMNFNKNMMNNTSEAPKQNLFESNVIEEFTEPPIINSIPLKENRFENKYDSLKMVQTNMLEPLKLDSVAIQKDIVTGKNNKLDSNNTILIQPLDEKSQSNVFFINETGAKLGRFSDNTIVILEESVSRHHAEISFNRGKFFIQDIGSSTGTFIKVIDKVQVEEEMIFELGSRCFEITVINTADGKIEVRMKIVDGPDLDKEIEFKLSERDPSYVVGRKQGNLCYLDDQHLSSKHASFNKIANKLYIEDLGSTNGSWKRLSKSGEQSDKIPLAEDCIFKVGQASLFKVKRLDSLNKQEKPNTNTNECIICCENEKDALFSPCHHNISCMKCSSKLKNCPMCRGKVERCKKIFKN